jgi:proline-specific peptidase
MLVREEFVAFRGRRVWCAVAGESGATPLVCVPGGPGAPHDYLLSLSALAGRGRQVVFYDPVGSGDSERPTGTAWTHELYVAELDAVCRGLGLARYHLWAHSAAGLAAYPHALARPPELASLILSSAPADMAGYTAHLERLLVGLGVAPEELAALEDPANLRRSTRYARIFSAFFARYMCRVRPIPQVIMKMDARTNSEAYLALKGGRILYTTALRVWDVRARLGEIAVPTLFTCGRHDMVDLAACQEVQQRIPRCELAIFEESGHMQHVDEEAAYVEKIDAFLRANE